MIPIVAQCDLCDATAGIGMSFEDAQANAIDQGGRVFGSTLTVCAGCAEQTR